MQQLLHRFSSQDQKLYGLILQACAAALVLGLLFGLISFNSNKADGTDNWQATSLTPAPDATTEFSTVTANSRWFREKGAMNPAQAEAEAKKAIEGQPESLKLIGVVERSGRVYALFLPVAGGGAQNVSQFAAGDTLVGDWKVKEVSTSRVIVESSKEGAETQTKELSLYSSKK
jgi:hypothetical protein